MAELAKNKFSLDGGYDRELVEACRHHPHHDWWEFRLGDVLEAPHDPEERMVICRACFVPRCGYTTDTDPCMLPRHHSERHLYASGAGESTASWPGSDKPSPPAPAPGGEG